MTAAGVLIRCRGGELMVQARPSEVPPDQLDALRRHKAELAPIIETFGEVAVLIRPKAEAPEFLAERMSRIRKRLGKRARA